SVASNGTVLAGTFAAPDGFVASLSPSGSTLGFSTYFGGVNSDSIQGIALDGSANIYLTGGTNSNDFPTVRGSEPTPSANDFEAFMPRLSPAGDQIFYSTYLGGAGDDSGAAIAVDSQGDAFLSGTTSSSDFLVAGAIQNALDGPSDAFLAKYSPTGVPVYA